MWAFKVVVGAADITAGWFLTSIFRVIGWIKEQERMVMLSSLPDPREKIMSQNNDNGTVGQDDGQKPDRGQDICFGIRKLEFQAWLSHQPALQS